MSILVVQQSAATWREYHTKAQLTEQAIESRHSSLGGVGSTIAAMRGVTDVFVRRYSVSVARGVAFTWEEVEPQILEFLTMLEQANA